MIAGVFALVAVPALSLAATYAYVNQEGEVRTVVADTPQLAITTAPNIHQNSGVLLLDSQEDNAIVGDEVQTR